MAQETIYLDDARIGRFRPKARKLHQRFLELVADAPSSRDVWNFFTTRLRESDIQQFLAQARVESMYQMASLP